MVRLSAVVIGALLLCPAAVSGDRGAARSAFPPSWKLGQEWRAVMRTVEPRAEMARGRDTPLPPKPPLRALEYQFRVIAIPDARHDQYQLELHPIDPDQRRGYVLSYRRDFSLARIEERDQAGPTTVIEPADRPFIYYERYRVSIVADFPFAPDGKVPAHRELVVSSDTTLVQDVRVEADRTHITLLQREPLGSLRVELEWLPGQPWWSTIECSENAPPSLHYPPDIVATGALE